MIVSCLLVVSFGGVFEALGKTISPANLLQDGGGDGPGVPIASCPGVRGQLPSGWLDNSCWHASTQVSYGMSDQQARTGRSLKVVLTQGLFQLVQAVNLEADRRYELGVWLRSAEPMVVKLSLRQSGAPYQEYGARSIRTSAQWTYASVSGFSNGLSQEDARQALFMISSATPGTVWLDDASLVSTYNILRLPAAPVPAQYFGSHAMHMPNIKSAFEEGRAGSLRIWDSEGSQWNTVQPTRPKGGKRKYAWDALDARADIAREHEGDLLMVLGGYAPAWASLDEGDPDEWPRDSLACFRCDEHPKRLEDWKNWVTDVVTRYKGSPIRYWEIWNEPHFGPKHSWCADQRDCITKLGSGFRGTPEQLLILQDEAAQIIKRVDPTAKVVSAGVSLYHRDYLDYFLRIGGGKTADVISYHLYVEGLPEQLMSHILAIRALMGDHGVADKPLWNTETAIMGINPESDPAWRAAKAAKQNLPSVRELGPAYLARSLIVSWASGMGRHYHYAWDDHHRWPSSPTETARGTNLAIGVNDAGQAYRQVVSWMTGKRMVAMETGAGGGLWQATLQDANGKLSYIAWHPARTSANAWPLKNGGNVRKMCDLGGACRTLASDSTVSVDFRPVYLTP